MKRAQIPVSAAWLAMVQLLLQIPAAAQGIKITALHNIPLIDVTVCQPATSSRAWQANRPRPGSLHGVRADKTGPVLAIG